jgi:hypothetical protein
MRLKRFTPRPEGFRWTYAPTDVRIKKSHRPCDPDHSSRVNPIGWTGFDPLLPFKIGRVNRRIAHKSCRSGYNLRA